MVAATNHATSSKLDLTLVSLESIVNIKRVFDV